MFSLAALCSESHLWVDRIGLDSADADTILDCDSHVAIFAPGSSPRVLHDPMFTVSISSISNNEGGVVSVGSTICRVENTACV